jgi:hypothetical protein
MNDAIEYYLAMARSDRVEDAFHGLLELPESPASALREAYLVEADGLIRAFLVRVIWQRRQASSIPFLIEALGDTHPEAWKQALDGLCTLGAAEELQALMSASQQLDDERRTWIAEAIEGLGDEVRTAHGDMIG